MWEGDTYIYTIGQIKAIADSYEDYEEIIYSDGAIHNKAWFGMMHRKIDFDRAFASLSYVEKEVLNSRIKARGELYNMRDNDKALIQRGVTDIGYRRGVAFKKMVCFLNGSPHRE